jgi:hypothetical protein
MHKNSGWATISIDLAVATSGVDRMHQPHMFAYIFTI